MTQEKSETEQKLEVVKQEIGALSSKLKTLNQEKEAKYQEKEKISTDLNQLIQEANELKDAKSKIDEQIKKAKIERDRRNKFVSELANKIKDSRPAALSKEYVPIRKLKSMLEEMELRIQTEALAFEKEQALMTKIKDLRAEVKRAEASEAQLDDLRGLQKQIAEAKRLSDEAHREVQVLAVKSSEVFDQLTKKSKSISEMKKSKSLLRKILMHLKDDMRKINRVLSDRLSHWSEGRKYLHLRTEGANAARLQAKVNVAKEKLASKKKLTTDDILALQRDAMKQD